MSAVASASNPTSPTTTRKAPAGDPDHKAKPEKRYKYVLHFYDGVLSERSVYTDRILWQSDASSAIERFLGVSIGRGMR